jgi:hypothetical protein
MPSAITELERHWAGRSDAQVIEAMTHLDDYTEEGRIAVRAELVLRALPAPGVDAEPAFEAIDFVTVAHVAGDPVFLSFAESVLDDAGIVCRLMPAFAEGVAFMSGMDTVSSWNLQVERGRVDEARQLLDEIEKMRETEVPPEE